MIEISKENARDFLVNYQGLSDFGQFEGYEGAKRFLSRVRCIQYDPLDVVGRNPDLVLQSRVKNYRPQMLYDLSERLYKPEILNAPDPMLEAIGDAFRRFSEYLGVPMLPEVEWKEKLL